MFQWIIAHQTTVHFAAITAQAIIMNRRALLEY